MNRVPSSFTGRPTDRARGARMALDASHLNRTPQLFKDADSCALTALWESIFNSAQQTLLEERWAAEVRAGGSGCAAVLQHPFPRNSREVTPIGPNSNTGQKGSSQ